MSTPTGTVLLKINGNGITSLPLDANGNASYSWTPGGTGPDAFEADYSGDSNWNAAVGTATEQVNDPQLGTPVVTVTPTPNPGTVGQPITIAISVEAGS
jgi:hypothetical protein